MSIGKKIGHKAQAAKGAAKKFFGRATGNTRLRTEGRVDQFKGNTKQAGTRSKMRSNTDPPARLTTLTATTGLRCPRSTRLARSIRDLSLPGTVGPCVRQRSTSPARPYVSISTIWRIHGPHI